MSTKVGLDYMAEAVAKAQRALHVATVLRNDYSGKLRMAEDELANADRHLRDSQHNLTQAALVVHEEAHGSSFSPDDEAAFENRYAAKVAKLVENRRRSEAGELPLPSIG